MRNRFVLSSATNALLVLLCACGAWAQTTAIKVTPQAGAALPQRVAIQVNDSDPKVMNLALNNAKNVIDYYKGNGQSVTVEVITYGPGLHMLRGDTSPVKQRVAEMSLSDAGNFLCGVRQHAGEYGQAGRQGRGPGERGARRSFRRSCG